MAIKDTIARAESLMEEFSLPRDFLERIGLSVAQIYRRVRIGEVAIGNGTIKQVDVDRVNLGRATIDRIEIRDLTAQLNSAEARLENVQTLTELEFELDWEVDLGFLGSWDGSENLGSIDIPFNLGHVSIPSLSNIAMTIPSVTVPTTEAEMAPITDLSLGPTQLVGAQVLETTLPTAGFNLTGMGVGSLDLSAINVPGTTTKRAHVQELTPSEQITLPGANIQNLSIPSTSIPNIESGAFDTSASASDREISVDLGILALTLRVIPTVHLDVGRMVLNDVELAAEARSLNLQDIRLPVSVRGITVDDIALEEVIVNHISL